MFRKSFISTAAVICLGVANARASTVFIFDEVLDGQPPIGGLPPYARLTLTSSAPDTVHFQLEHLSGGVDPGRFISRLVMNLEPFTVPVTLANPSLPIGFVANQNGINDAGFRFDLDFQFPTSQPDRILQGQSASWDLVASGLSESDFMMTAPRVNGSSSSVFSLLHMQAIGADGQGSTKLTGTPVPEPATIFGLGLCTAWLAGRRRKVK